MRTHSPQRQGEIKTLSWHIVKKLICVLSDILFGNFSMYKMRECVHVDQSNKHKLYLCMQVFVPVMENLLIKWFLKGRMIKLLVPTIAVLAQTRRHTHMPACILWTHVLSILFWSQHPLSSSPSSLCRWHCWVLRWSWHPLPWFQGTDRFQDPFQGLFQLLGGLWSNRFLRKDVLPQWNLVWNTALL